LNIARYRKWLPAVGIAILLAIAVLLWDRIRSIDFHDVLAQIRSLPPSTLVAAVALAACAYTLVGIYEGLALAYLTGQRRMAYAIRTTWIANPIGRAIGAPLLSSTALRYRFYSALGLDAKQVGGVVVLLSLSYVLAVGWLIDLSLLLYPGAATAMHLTPASVTAIALLGLCKDCGWLALVRWRRRPLRIGRALLVLPSLPHTVLQIVFGMAQLLCNTAILYLALPAEIGMSWPAFVAIYCIAFIAGQVSHVPAGLGVFEATLLLLLPHVPPGKLLGAVIVYRTIFEILPLLVGAALWIGYEGRRVRARAMASRAHPGAR
jgi:phosphatidylglycerol lysyltransferase